MFSSVFDAACMLRVSRLWDPPQPTDIGAVIRTMEDFDRETLRAARLPVHLFIDEGSSPFNAADRKRIAQTAKGLRAPRLLFVLVSPSTLQRGVLKAITWLVPPRPGHLIDAFATLAEAHRWAESTSQEALPSLPAIAARAGFRPGG